MNWWKLQLVITDDNENSKESVITSSSPSIISYLESSSLTILSVNDEVKDSLDKIME